MCKSITSQGAWDLIAAPSETNALLYTKFGVGTFLLWGLRGKAFVIASYQAWKATHRILITKWTTQCPELLKHLLYFLFVFCFPEFFIYHFFIQVYIYTKSRLFNFGCFWTFAIVTMYILYLPCHSTLFLEFIHFSKCSHIHLFLLLYCSLLCEYRTIYSFSYWWTIE